MVVKSQKSTSSLEGKSLSRDKHWSQVGTKKQQIKSNKVTTEDENEEKTKYNNVAASQLQLLSLVFFENVFNFSDRNKYTTYSTRI